MPHIHYLDNDDFAKLAARADMQQRIRQRLENPDMNKTSRTETKHDRQEAVRVNHRDLSSHEIAATIEHKRTVVSLYEGQRSRCKSTIDQANVDTHVCDLMIDELSADIATLNEIIKTRKS